MKYEFIISLEKEKFMDKCLICGGQEYSIIHKGTRDIKNIDVLKCNNCGAVRLSSFEQIYDGFYENSGMRENKEITKLTEESRDDVRRATYFMKDYFDKSILDFGCGKGGYLKLAKNYASKVAGVELENEPRENLISEGIDVRKDINDFTDKFDFITMFHVVEHLIDPLPWLGNIKNHLKEGGELIVETPNADDILLTQYGCEAFKDFTYWGCHVRLYTSKTLEKLLEMAGFKIKWSKQIQRYPLANHLYWLREGKPGGQKKWNDISSEVMNSEYERILAEKGMCDTLLISVTN